MTVILEKRKDYSIQIRGRQDRQGLEMLDQYKADRRFEEQGPQTLAGHQEADPEGEQHSRHLIIRRTRRRRRLRKPLKHVESAKVKAGDKTPAKPVKYVQPSKVAVKNYLETEADIEEFLEALKKELEAALREHAASGSSRKRKEA